MSHCFDIRTYYLLLKKSFVFSLSLIIEQGIDFESTEIPAEAEASRLNVTYYHIPSLSISPLDMIEVKIGSNAVVHIKLSHTRFLSYFSLTFSTCQPTLRYLYLAELHLWKLILCRMMDRTPAAAGCLCSLRAARADPIRFRSNLVELGIYFDPP